MSEDLLKDLAEYRTMRGERGIIMAARSLIQLYRAVDPSLLPPKLRGVDYDREESAAKKTSLRCLSSSHRYSWNGSSLW